MTLSIEQQIQEQSYDFPYHYLPRMENGRYTQTTTLNWGYEYLYYINFVMALIQEKEFNSLLDVGCGDGRLLFELNNKVDDKRLVGIDFSERAINHAKAMSPHVEYIYGDITDTSIFDTKFDLTTLIETLEHIPPNFISEFLAGVHHYLNDNGQVLITVPCANVPLHRKHYQHFTLKSLQETLSPYFEVTDHFYLNKITRWSKYMPLLLANRIFVLQEPTLLNLLHKRYAKNLGIAEAHNAARICVVCKKSEV